MFQNQKYLGREKHDCRYTHEWRKGKLVHGVMCKYYFLCVWMLL